MAAVTAIIAGATAAYSVGSSIYKSSQEKKEKERAERDLANYKRKPLENTMANLSLPTAGAQMEREEVIRAQATAARDLSQMGTTGASNISELATMSAKHMRDIGSRLDKSQFNLNQLKAEDESRIRDIYSAREEQDIAGIGSRINTATQNKAALDQQAISSMASLAEISMDTSWGDKKLWGNAKTPSATPSETKIY
jgi:hypothetical protein